MKKVILRFLIILILMFPTYLVIHRIIYSPQYSMINTLQSQLIKEKIDLIELNALMTVKSLYSSNLNNKIAATDGYQNAQLTSRYLDLKNQIEKARTNNKIDIIRLKNLQKKVRLFKVAK